LKPPDRSTKLNNGNSSQLGEITGLQVLILMAETSEECLHMEQMIPAQTAEAFLPVSFAELACWTSRTRFKTGFILKHFSSLE
jgi:hypothetical protein